MNTPSQMTAGTAPCAARAAYSPCRLAFAIWAVLLLFGLRISGSEEQQTCFSPTLEFEHATATKQKYGWQESHFEYLGSCPDAVFPINPPKIQMYKSCIIDTYFSITNFAWPESEVITPQSQTIKVADIDTGETRTVAVSGHAVCTNDTTGCESFLTLEGGWSPCDVCPEVQEDFSDLMELYSYAQFHSFECSSTPTTYADQSIDGVNLLPDIYSVRTWTNSARLEDEYTTEELVSRVKSDLDDQTYLTGGNCASMELSEDEKIATATKLRVKFSFPTQPGYHYTLKWRERTTLSEIGSCGSDGIVQPDSEQEVSTDGDGQLFEYEREVPAPDTEGWTVIADAKVCYDDEGGTGPGPNPVPPPHPPRPGCRR